MISTFNKQRTLPNKTIVGKRKFDLIAAGLGQHWKAPPVEMCIFPGCLHLNVLDHDTCLLCGEYAIAVVCQLCMEPLCHGCICSHWTKQHGMTNREFMVSHQLNALALCLPHALFQSGDLTISLWHLVAEYTDDATNVA